ncbi:FBD-associated F-box protein At5g22730-like [Lotus japonicus]|uniref:FBD-associated F-box protein At5g22730-like n=1 Tax=Lotus japonicus TaxID=34305 RepID=UPI002591226A|nr:FBD-associated F-box protein At5g22730-like [Lotus japonicus]
MADRISKLPDEVLCQILSFLPTEDAVATSVLCKRWSSLWLSVPTLDFDDYRYLKGKKLKLQSSFINFVYAIILSRALHQPIKNFTLSVISEECPYPDVKVWLNAAMQRQVENLDICLSLSTLPCSILSCTTLVVLKLSDVKFHVFSCVDLPSLKTLHLELVVILNPQSLMDLLYGCPVLEDLEIDEIPFVSDDGPSFEGKVKSLSKLVRAEVFLYDDFCIPVEAFRNVQVLHLNQCDADIPVFHNLIHMKLFFGHSITWSVALDMLNHCPKLQTVVFDLTSHDEDDVWLDPSFVPECFSSHLRKCFLRDFEGLECHMRFARYVLKNSTSLRTMTIHSMCQNREKEHEMIKEFASYPRSSSICELLFK